LIFGSRDLPAHAAAADLILVRRSCCCGSMTRRTHPVGGSARGLRSPPGADLHPQASQRLRLAVDGWAWPAPSAWSPRIPPPAGGAADADRSVARDAPPPRVLLDQSRWLPPLQLGAARRHVVHGHIAPDTPRQGRPKQQRL